MNRKKKINAIQYLMIKLFGGVANPLSMKVQNIAFLARNTKFNELKQEILDTKIKNSESNICFF
jgi:hypothetical protein